MVEAMDQAVGKVVHVLDRLELADNTIVFFMSDNGGLSTSEGHPTSNLPLRAGKGWMYEGGIREPMIVRTAEIEPGSECHDAVTSTDFYPTILELAGLPHDSYVEVMLSGVLLSGESFEAYDCLRIVGNGNYGVHSLGLGLRDATGP